MPLHRPPALFTTATLATGALLLTGCASVAAAPPHEPATELSDSRIALTYDGGLLVVDGESLETIVEIPAEGFLRVNTAGDDNGHVFVTTTAGFQVLDTGLVSGTPALTDTVFAAEGASHAVVHEGRTALFADGTGDITLFDTADTSGTALPETETVASEEAHHGVAIELSDGRVLSTLGTEDARSGVRVLDAARTETLRNEECPSVHGEGVLAGETVVFGCENGALVYADGAFTKLAAPDAYGRIGNAYVTESSPIAVMDYKSNPDAEGYLLTQLAIVNTDAATLDVVALPDGVSYTWQGVGRDAHDNVVLISSDGSLYVLDEAGAVVDSWPLIEPWQSPAEWQEAHPALKVVGDTAYVTEPAAQKIYAVDLHDGKVLAEGELPAAPAELVVVGETTGH